jgi:hypothetical protein
MKDLPSFIAIRHEAIGNELRGGIDYTFGVSFEMRDDLAQAWEYEVAYHENHRCTFYCATALRRHYLTHLKAEHIPVILQMREEYEILPVPAKDSLYERAYVSRRYESGTMPHSTEHIVMPIAGGGVVYCYTLEEAIEKEIVVVPAEAARTLQAKRRELIENADAGTALDWFYCPSCEECDRAAQAVAGAR